MSNLETLVKEGNRFRCYQTEHERVSVEMGKYQRPVKGNGIKFFRNNDIGVVFKNLIVQTDLSVVNEKLKTFEGTDVVTYLKELDQVQNGQEQIQLDLNDLEEVIIEEIKVFLKENTVSVIKTYCSNHQIECSYKRNTLILKGQRVEVEPLVEVVKEKGALDDKGEFTFVEQQ